MQPVKERRQFDEFLNNCFSNRTILNYTVKSLTKLGDNWGSVLQAVEVKLATKNDSNAVKSCFFYLKHYRTRSSEIHQMKLKYFDFFQIETRQLVCKTMIGPNQDPKQFLKELHFYSEIIPAIERFERDANVPQTERIDAFVPYVGSRSSIDPSNSFIQLKKLP